MQQHSYQWFATISKLYLDNNCSNDVWIDAFKAATINPIKQLLISIVLYQTSNKYIFLQDLCDRLYDICDNRKEMAENERLSVMYDGWLEDRLGLLTNHYLTLMQVEVDRYQDTMRVLKDYYNAMEGNLLTVFLLLCQFNQLLICQPITM